jgi:hypothetical protein
VEPLRVPAVVRRSALVVAEQREGVLGVRLVQDGDERPLPAAPAEQLRRLDRAQVRRLVRLEMQIGLVQGAQRTPARTC